MNFLLYGLAGLFVTGAGYFFLKKKSGKSFGKNKVSGYLSLDKALLKTRESFLKKLKNSFSGKSTISRNEVEKLEEALYTSDLGPKTVEYLIERLKQKIEVRNFVWDDLRQALRDELNSIFEATKTDPLKLRNNQKTNVWMIVGVNGAGKTTTIGKLASQSVKPNRKVLIVAGDTFRAAADRQLETWARRSGSEFFNPQGLQNPSALAFEALQKAVSKNFDLVLVDTAGRLHTQKNLMEELKKMKRVMNKALSGAPHETLLVLDANSGQNALMQAEQFHKALGVTGVILTKMDGSAKGGVAVGISLEHKLPIKMIGVGEKIEDLRVFNSREFVDSIL